MKIITYLPSLMVPFLIASSTVKIKASKYGGYLIFTVLGIKSLRYELFIDIMIAKYRTHHHRWRETNIN